MTNPTPAASNDTYKLGRRLNAGSTGVIYEAKHPWLPGQFAVKVLRNVLAQVPEAINIFRAELAAVGSLAHPNIVHIVEIGSTPDGIPFVVMELLEGRPLAARLLEGRPVPVSEVVGIVKGAAAGLDAAHNRGVIHCELNPGNIFLSAAGGEEFGYTPKILDFGIARLRNSNGGDAGVGADTARTMAPEQAQGRGDEIDGRTDQFAVAAIAYRMITGVDAFRGDDAIGVLYQVVHEAPPPMTDHTRVDPRIEAVLRRALAKRRSDRFDSMASFSHALDEASQGPYQDDTGMRMVANGEPVTATPVPGSEPHLSQPRVSPFAGSSRGGAPLAQDTALTPPRHRPPLAFAHPRGGVLKDSGEWTGGDEEPLDFGDDRVRVPKERWRITLFLAALVVLGVAGAWWAGWRPPLAWRQSQLWQALHLPAGASEPVNVEVEKPAAATAEPEPTPAPAAAPTPPPAAPTPTMETPLPAAAVAIVPDAGAATAAAVPPPAPAPAVPAAAPPVAAAPAPAPAAAPDDEKERKARERAKRRREELEAERDLVWSEEAGRLVPSDWTPPSDRRRSRPQEPAPAPPSSQAAPSKPQAAPSPPQAAPSPSSPAPPTSPGIAPPTSIGSMGSGSGAPAEKPAPVPTAPARP